MKLGIGTAQFGLDYGISNQEGKTPLEEVARILEVATQNGVRVIDTAQLYGTSEEVLGKTLPRQHNFDIVTKTPHFSNATVIGDDAQFLEDTFYQSLSKLGQSSIYALLIHRADDLLVENGHLLIEKMLWLKQQKLVQKVGVSVYTGEQIEQIISRYSIDIVQLPINVLDQRLLLSGHLLKLKKLGIEIHARSVFLQGLLLMVPECLPSYFDSVKGHLKKYRNFIYQHGVSATEAALSFVLAMTEIDIVVCGVNNCQQFQELILGIKETRPILGKEISKFVLADTSIVNPSKWRV